MSTYFPRALHTASPDTRVIVLVSDVEMGAPGPEDDFPHDAYLAELFEAYTRPPYDGLHVDLVLNGDILDFLKTPTSLGYSRHVTADMALEKLDVILGGHPAFIEGLRAFGTHESGSKHIRFLPGNHDPEVLFPEVAQRLKDLLVGCAAVRVHGLTCRIGPVHIEHGHQYDRMFRMDPNQYFVPYRGDSILLLPWGSCALLDVVMPLKHLFYHYDRLRPKTRVLERLPQLEELLLGAFKRYWMREYIWDALTRFDDPTRNLSWDMIKDIVYRLVSSNTDVSMEDEPIIAMLSREPDLQAVCFGHLHVPAWRMLEQQHIVRTGCMRDEYLVDPYTDELHHLPKSWGEVILQGNVVRQVRVFHAQGPARPAGSYPEDPFVLSPEMEQVWLDLKEG